MSVRRTIGLTLAAAAMVTFAGGAVAAPAAAAPIAAAPVPGWDTIASYPNTPEGEAECKDERDKLIAAGTPARCVLFENLWDLMVQA